MTSPERRPTTAEPAVKAKALLARTILGVISQEPEWDDFGLAADVPLELAADVERLCDTPRGYRDAVLCLLAFPTANDTIYDLTDRFEGDRPTSDWLGMFLRSHDITAVKSALQNSSFRHSFVHDRIDSPELRRILVWASDPVRTSDEVRRVFERIARRTAETARIVPPLPGLDATRFTFQQTLAVIDRLLAVPSGGAVEQYIFASLKAAEIETSTERLKVETKNVNAADAGRIAADVQVVRGQSEVVEAFEVAAAAWTDKVVQAAEIVQQHGLARIHIVANSVGTTAAQITAGITAAALPSSIDARLLDVSVLDLRSELKSLVARLSKSGRRCSWNACGSVWPTSVMPTMSIFSSRHLPPPDSPPRGEVAMAVVRGGRCR